MRIAECGLGTGQASAVAVGPNGMQGFFPAAFPSRTGWRVVFADYDQEEVAVLIWAFPKNRQANLTASQKKVVRELKMQLDKEIRLRYGKGK
jgi:hypothetical protein